MFDIIVVRWINFFLIIGAIYYGCMLVKGSKTHYLRIPFLIWLLQTLIFYSVFFLYFYGIFDIQIDTAEKLFSYWATLSKTLGLITIYTYLYYIQHSCWRGKGSL